jgi:hypothetical protein
MWSSGRAAFLDRGVLPATARSATFVMTEYSCWAARNFWHFDLNRIDTIGSSMRLALPEYACQSKRNVYPMVLAQILVMCLEVDFEFLSRGSERVRDQDKQMTDDGEIDSIKGESTFKIALP